jgi:myo-inositol 2-dehydrogenase / D-chiro-inositol 1-dehydrogenase
MSYNVAIIGAGAWSHNHLTGWQAQPDATITWLVRSTEAKAKERATLWGVPNWSADYRQVLERDDVQIVDILLPHDLHAEVACLALAHGKHVVLEKPLATSLAGARQIAEAAHRYQRKVMVSENWVYGTMVRKARALIEQGEIGTPFMIRSTNDMDPRPSFVGLDWRYSQERMGGGALLDAGSHPVSACRFLLGEIREVSAIMANHGFPEITPLEDTCLLLLRFESGASGSLEFTWLAQRERPRTEFIILGDKGTIEFDTFSRQFFVTRNKRRAEEFEIQPSRGFVEQMAHFLECVREDRTPLTSPEEQMGSLRAILAAYRSAESGRMVRVKDVE